MVALLDVSDADLWGLYQLSSDLRLPIAAGMPTERAHPPGMPSADLNFLRRTSI
jgi:hypothetical protein